MLNRVDKLDSISGISLPFKIVSSIIVERKLFQNRVVFIDKHLHRIFILDGLRFGIDSFFIDVSDGPKENVLGNRQT